MERTVDGAGAPCGWLVEVPNPALNDPDWWADSPADMVRIVECGAPTVVGDWGWRCDAGHEYVNTETRWSEGWDYSD